MINHSFPIVAIGASAGGQEALLEFFRNLPTEPNSAFIVVTHLSPLYESRLDRILAGVSPLPTSQIQDGDMIENNHLYVMPEGVVLTIKDGRLILSPRTNTINRAVDDFFISVARDQKERVIGIVMSGSGTDGTTGVNEIHKYGGKVFIQSPSLATFSSMPQSAIVRDHPDGIASPAMLAQHICTLMEV